MLVKNKIKYYSLAIIIFFLMAGTASAKNELVGRILIDKNNKTQIWYVDPVSGQRAFMGNTANISKAINGLGVGVTEKEFELFKKSFAARKNFSGKIIFRKESKHETYYVDPKDLNFFYLGSPDDFLALAETQGLKVSDKILQELVVADKYKALTGAQVASLSTAVKTQGVKISNGQLIAKNACTNWLYSDWTPCSPWGNQTRSIVVGFPIGCAGGNYTLEQACVNLGKFTLSNGSISGVKSLTDNDSSLDDLIINRAYADKGKNVNLQCKPWFNVVALEASNGLAEASWMNSDGVSWDLKSGKYVTQKKVAINNVARADVLQMNSINNVPHTAVIVSRTSSGMVWIHSNWAVKKVVSVDFITFDYFNANYGNNYSVYHLVN